MTRCLGAERRSVATETRLDTRPKDPFRECFRGTVMLFNGFDNVFAREPGQVVRRARLLGSERSFQTRPSRGSTVRRTQSATKVGRRAWAGISTAVSMRSSRSWRTL